MIAHLYKVTNKITGSYYVGKHNGFEQNGYWGSGFAIKGNIAKYGQENFEYKILCYGTPKYILELESRYVTLELIESDTKCLNLSAGGLGGGRITEETRKKIGLASTTRQIGKKHKLETKEKISKSLKGVPTKDKTKKIIGEIFSKRIWVNNGVDNRRIESSQVEEFKQRGYFFGRTALTEEHRKNIGEAVKGRKRKPESILKMKLTNKRKKELLNG